MVVSELILSLVMAAVMIPVNGLLLMLSTKIFKLADQSYSTAVKLCFITGVAGFALAALSAFVPARAWIISIASWVIISILLAVWLVKTNYNLDWGKALLVWLVWFVLSIVAAFIIALIVGVVFVAVGLSALSSGMMKAT